MKHRMKNKFYSLRDFYSEYFCLELAPGETVSLTLTEIVNRRLQIYSFVDEPSSRRGLVLKPHNENGLFWIKIATRRGLLQASKSDEAHFSRWTSRGRNPAEKRRDAPRRAAEK